MAKILIVEDNENFSGMVADLLTSKMHTVEQVFTGGEAADRLRLYEYDLVVMDWELPGKSGIEVTREYRASGGLAPILFLTGKDTLPDKVEGFNIGADDYLTKPFQIPELMVRIQALLRRPQQYIAQTLNFRHLTVDLASSTVKSNGVEVKLLPREFALLEFMLSNRGRVFDHDTLLNKVWSSESSATSEAIMTCVKRLRKKLDIEGSPSVITTVHGLGYRIDQQ